MPRTSADSDERPGFDPWLEQMRRGGLELAILLTLSRAPRYGLEIIRHLEAETDLVVAEGTIYPILARLTRDRLLDSQWREEGVHPRKYYRLSPRGRERLREMTAAWEEFTRKMSRLMTAARGGDHAAE
jgi:PadR family transcriptional regulator, regulatory protein PadR